MTLPVDVSYNILSKIEDEDIINTPEADIIYKEVFNLTRSEIEYFRTSLYYKHLIFAQKQNKSILLELFAGGIKKRIKKYNQLTMNKIIRGPKRINCDEIRSHKFLPVNYSDEMTCEPEYYYPVDESSVKFWNQVHETERMLLRFKVASFWKERREHGLEVDVLGNHLHFQQCSESISGVAYKMEHQLAKSLLYQKIKFKLNEIK